MLLKVRLIFLALEYCASGTRPLHMLSMIYALFFS